MKRKLRNPRNSSEIGAKTLYPVHTEFPDLYKKVSENMVLIDEGKKYDL